MNQDNEDEYDALENEVDNRFAYHFVDDDEGNDTTELPGEAVLPAECGFSIKKSLCDMLHFSLMYRITFDLKLLSYIFTYHNNILHYWLKFEK